MDYFPALATLVPTEDTNTKRSSYGYAQPTRAANTGVATFANAGAALQILQPEVPVHLFRPHELKKTAQRFLAAFDGTLGGTTMYAVKCNPDAQVIAELWQAGVRAFDVASLPEIQLVRSVCPQAMLAFMHPIKAPAAIRAAYFDYGVRTFVLDHPTELQKILTATDNAKDLTLVVRLTLPKGNAKLDLSGKFGAPAELAIELLREAEVSAPRLGLSFHVGSQCEDPNAYVKALTLAADVVAAAGVELDVLDIGGGFPASYPGMVPPDLSRYMTAIEQTVKRFAVLKNTELWAEPGRGLVASSGSLLTRVELRKDNQLYLNDGTYGSLFDAGSVCDWNYPVRLWRNGQLVQSKKQEDFSFYGPTCDTIDAMAGPFPLPADVREGDWLEIGQLGAYGKAMRTNFNGFGTCLQANVKDAAQVVVK